jgi:DNA-binding NarL/FixJ family response regulator
MLLAFEDKLFAEGLTALIGPWNEFRLMATVTNNDEVLRYVLESRPALILMGARMQGVPCSETIRAIAAAAAQTRAVVICSYSESADVLDVLRAGAMGYGIREELSADRLRGFLWGVASGEIVLSNPICARLQDALSRPVDTPAVGNCFFDALTKREREVLALLVEGLSNAEIGQQLYLSEPTIKKIISQINSKLNTTNRVQAAVLATRHMPTRQE